MKKYVKPDLYYENFQLTSSVASGCGTVLGHHQETCEMDLEERGWGDGTLFVEGVNCDIDWRTFEGYCYTNGSGDMVLFTS